MLSSNETVLNKQANDKSDRLHRQAAYRDYCLLFKYVVQVSLINLYELYNPEKAAQYLKQIDEQSKIDIEQSVNLVFDEEPSIKLNKLIKEIGFLSIEAVSVVFQFSDGKISQIKKEIAAKKLLTGLDQGKTQLSTCRTIYNFFSCRNNLREEIEKAETGEQSYTAAWYNISGEMAPRVPENNLR